MSTLTIAEKSCYRPLVRERLRVAWQNWKVRKVGKAWCTIEKAIRDDPGYRITIHANIAMPIYDSTRPKCWCDWQLVHPHTEKCELNAAAAGDARYALREMPIEQANYIADRIMKILYSEQNDS